MHTPNCHTLNFVCDSAYFEQGVWETTLAVCVIILSSVVCKLERNKTQVVIGFIFLICK